MKNERKGVARKKKKKSRDRLGHFFEENSLAWGGIN